MGDDERKNVPLIQIANGDRLSTSSEKAIVVKKEVIEEDDGNCGEFSHQSAPFDGDDCQDFSSNDADEMEAHSKSCPVGDEQTEAKTVTVRIKDCRLMKRCACPFCGRSNRHYYALNGHIVRHHRTELAIGLITSKYNFRKPFMCSACKTGSRSPSGLIRHWYIYKCGGRACLPTYGDYQRAHAVEFNPRRPNSNKRLRFSYYKDEEEEEEYAPSNSDDECQGFPSIDADEKGADLIPIHMWNKGGNKGDPRLMKKCECPYCGRSQRHYYALNDHIMKHHRTELAVALNTSVVNYRKPFLCSACNKGARNVRGLLIHWNKFECDGTASLVTYEEYKKAHAENPAKIAHDEDEEEDDDDEEEEEKEEAKDTYMIQGACPYCGKTMSVFALSPHMKKCHRKEEECVDELSQDMEEDQQEEEESKDTTGLSCELCGHIVKKNQGALRRHTTICRRKNELEKISKLNPELLVPIVCPFCDESTEHTINLSKHIMYNHKKVYEQLSKTSDGEEMKKLFSCSMCNFSTMSPFDLAKHWSGEEDDNPCRGQLILLTAEEAKKYQSDIETECVAPKRAKMLKTAYVTETEQTMSLFSNEVVKEEPNKPADTTTEADIELPEPCDTCGKVVPFSALSWHTERCHPKERGLLRNTYICRRKNETEMISKLNPELLVPVVCPLCSVSTEHTFHLAKHIMYNHKKVYEQLSKTNNGEEMKKLFSCSMCNFSTMSPFDLAKHWSGEEDGNPCPGELILLTAEEAKKYQSDIETKSVAPKRAKVRKTALVTEKEQTMSLFSNDVVKEELNNLAAEVAERMEEIDDEAATIAHMMESANCPICEEEFSSFFSLGDHLPSHSVRLCFFQCSCGQGFKTPIALKNHITRRIQFGGCGGRGRVVSLMESKRISGQGTRTTRRGRPRKENEGGDSVVIVEKDGEADGEEPSTSTAEEVRNKGLQEKMEPEKDKEGDSNSYEAVEHLFRLVICPTCGNTCASYTDLQKHHTIKHNENEDKLVFLCDGCGRDYKLAKRLQAHLLQQYNRGVEECQYAGRAILQSRLKETRAVLKSMKYKKHPASDDLPMVPHTTKDSREPQKRERLPMSSFKANNSSSRLSVGQAIRDAIFNVQADTKAVDVSWFNAPMQPQMTSEQPAKGRVVVKQEVDEDDYHPLFHCTVKEEKI